MTAQEEITHLETQLNTLGDYSGQVKCIRNILKIYASMGSTGGQPYAIRLLQLANDAVVTLGKEESDRCRAQGLYYMALIHRQQGHNDVSTDMTLQAIAIFTRLNDTSGLGDAYTNVGTIHLNQGNYPEAMKCYLQAAELGKAINDAAAIGKSYVSIGNVYLYQGDYVEALENYSHALRIREEIKDTIGIAYLYNCIGGACDRMGNFAGAMENYLRSLQMQEESGNKDGVGVVCNNIGNVYKARGNHPEALKYYLRSLQIARDAESRQGAAIAYFNIGSCLERQGNDSEALGNYSLALNIQLEISDKRHCAYTYNNMGAVYEKQSDYTKALEHYALAFDIHRQLDNKHGMATSLNNIGNIHKKNADYFKAEESILQALELGELVGDKRRIAIAMKDLGDVYEKQSDKALDAGTRGQLMARAIKNKTEALHLNEEIGNMDNVGEIALSLSTTYKTGGDFENALKYHEKYHQTESEVINEASKQQFQNLNFMHNLEQKEKDLEIEQLRNVELKKERDRSENLLLNILPAEVAEELKNKGTAGARYFDEVTVLFTDFKGFTTVSERLTPQQLVDELHACFSAFDSIMHKYGIEKIKTVGDAYLAVAGLPLAKTHHAHDIARAAKEIIEFMTQRRAALGDMTFEIRIGVHSGAVVAGIVGIKKFAYDIWGDTVNTAARMEQNSEAGKINISEATYQLLKNNFTCTYRGDIEAKNKGKLKMYFLQ